MNEAEHSFLEYYDYLESLSNLLQSNENKNHINLLYEVAFASDFLNNLLNTAGTNTEFTTQIRELKSVFDTVLCSVSLEDLKDYFSGLEYGDLIIKRKGLTTYKIYESDCELIIPTDFNSLKSQFLLRLLTTSICLSIRNPTINKFIFSYLRSFDWSAIKILGSSMSIEPIIALFNTCLVIIIILNLLAISVETLYIFCPIVRYTPIAKQVSKTVKECCGMKTIDENIKTYNRIKRAIYWLSQLIKLSECEDLPESIGGLKLSEFKSHIKSLNNTVSNKQYSTTKEYLDVFVQIEKIYTKVIEENLFEHYFK